MSGLPQLAPLDVKEKRLYSENDWASHPFAKGESTHPVGNSCQPKPGRGENWLKLLDWPRGASSRSENLHWPSCLNVQSFSRNKHIYNLIQKQPLGRSAPFPTDFLCQDIYKGPSSGKPRGHKDHLPLAKCWLVDCPAGSSSNLTSKVTLVRTQDTDRTLRTQRLRHLVMNVR